MRDQLARLKLPLAMLVAMLLLVDADIGLQLYQNGFHFSWVAPKEGRISVGHEPALFALLDTVVIALFAAIHVGVSWLIWQTRKSRKSTRSPFLHLLFGDKPVISTEKDFRDFRFKSTIQAAIIPRFFALLLISVSGPFVSGWLHLSWNRLPYLILASPILLFLWIAAGIFLLGACQIHILDGQFRFRHFLTWKSVPFESISSVKRRWFGVDVSVDHEGKHYRFFFDPEDYKVGPSPPPVIQFLQEACRRNKESKQGFPS